MKRQRFVSMTLYALALGLVGTALFMAWNYLAATSMGDEVPSAEAITTSTDTPSERTPLSIDTPQAYTVPADEPRALRINSIGVASFVQRVGVDQYGQIAVPTNVHFTGWFIDSTKPGENGVTIIDGHVGGRYGGAVFSRLGNVREGDEIRLQKGDETWLTYRIEAKQTISPDNTQALTTHYTSALHELHLITCSGVYIPAEKTYESRLLVIAQLIDR